MSISNLRREYHRRMCSEFLRIKRSKKGDIEYPNFADVGMASSVAIGWGIVERIGHEVEYGDIAGQTAGRLFEEVTRWFIEESFGLLHHLRPGDWRYSIKKPISEFDQYRHLAELESLAEQAKALEISLGKISDYIIEPDIVIGRWPVSNDEVNQEGMVIGEDDLAALTPLREANSEQSQAILHASISCKWTLRSDRGQNARAEALNLVRHRKGNLPHIVAVTAEPMPTRIAALALGTGDLDCVYHFALHELIEAAEESVYEGQVDMLHTLLDGRRLRDISDLSFDLAI